METLLKEDRIKNCPNCFNHGNCKIEELLVKRHWHNHKEFFCHKFQRTKNGDSVISQLDEEQLFHITLLANLMRECEKNKIITPTQRHQVLKYVEDKINKNF